MMATINEQLEMLDGDIGTFYDNKYDADRDIGVDFNWIDAEVLWYIRRLISITQEQQKEIESLKTRLKNHINQEAAHEF